MSRFFAKSSSDRVATSSSAVAAPFSVGFWLRPDFDPTDNSADRYYWTSSDPEFRKFTDGNLYIGGLGNRIVVSAASCFIKWKWQFHLYTIDSSGNQYYYVDEVLKAGPTFAITGSVTSFVFGNHSSSSVGGDGWLRGAIVTNQFVTRRDEMRRLAYKPETISRSNIVGCWPMTGANTEIDLSPNRKDGTVTGSQASLQRPTLPFVETNRRFAGTSPPPPPPSTYIGARFQMIGSGIQQFSGGRAA